MLVMGTQARDYLRVSLDRSGQARSLDEQHTDNRRAASGNGWELGASYRDESVSASRYSRKATREGYDQLVEDLESGRFGADVLILWESSRGSRRVGEWVLLCDLLAERDVRVHVTTHGRTYDPNNPRDRRSLLEDAVDSEYESGKLSTRLKRSAAADAAAGKPPTKPAFGHPRKVRDDAGDKTPMPADQLDRERDAVRRLYSGLLAGRTLVSLANELNDAGHRTTRGGRWDRTDVRAMLLNARNAGIRYYRGERIGLINDGRDAIVTEETWQATVHMLTDPARKSNQAGTNRKWLGSGLFLCGLCGRSDMRINYREDGRVYRCRTSGHNSRTAEKVEAYVRATVAERLRRTDVARLLADSGQEQRAGELRTEAAGLRARLDSMGIDYAEGALTAGQVKAATERIETRLGEVDAELAAIGRSSRLAPLLTTADPGATFLASELDEQRSALSALCTVTLHPNRRGRGGLMSDTVEITWTS